MKFLSGSLNYFSSVRKYLFVVCALCHIYFPVAVSDIFQACIGVKLGVFVASTNGCEKYVYCDGVESFEDVCPDGLYFNANSFTCDIPENVICHLRQSISSTIPAENENVLTDISVTIFSDYSDHITSPLNTSQSIVSATETTHNILLQSINTVASNDKCPEVDHPESITFVAGLETCFEYFICYHGKPIPFYCANDLYFNAETKKCDFPENVNCKTLPQKDPTISCSLDQMELLPHPEKCEFFIYCVYGVVTVQQCPFYFHWDAPTSSCKLRNIARCASAIN